MNRSEKTQSPAFAYGPDDQTRVPRRHGNLGGACVWLQKLLATRKTHLEAKLLETEPFRKDTIQRDFLMFLC